MTQEDAEITLHWRQDQRAKFLKKTSKTVEQQRAWIISREQAGDQNFIMEYRGVPVGAIALVDIDHEHQKVELGRELIGEKSKVGSMPVAFETELLLCDYIFDQLGLHKVWGDVMEDNVGMIKTRLYLGYKQDGVLRDHYIYDGVYKNTIEFSLLEDEYRSICRPKLVQLIEFCSNFERRR